MANYAETSKNFTGAFMANLPGVNTGSVIPWSAASVPSGFLECNGQSVSTTTYAALFAVIAYTYGGSGGSFNVPDLTDRTIVNKSNTKALASTGGNNTVTCTGNCSATNSANTTLTTAQIASHTHTNWKTPAGGANACYVSPGTGADNMASTSAGSDGAHLHTISSITFTGNATSVLQPYLTLIYIIKT